MRLAIALLMTTVVVSSCGSSERDYGGSGVTPPAPVRSRACDEQTARSVGRLYYLANPINEQTHPETLEAYVLSNRESLSSGSSLLTCVSAAGNRLINQSILSFSRTDADRAFERSVDMGATPEQARSVSDSMNKGSIDNLIMGEELLWLAKVVPDAAAGNWGPFRNSATDLRRQIRQVWPLYQQLFAMDPSMKSVLEQALQDFQPWIEYQTASVVYILGE